MFLLKVGDLVLLGSGDDAWVEHEVACVMWDWWGQPWFRVVDGTRWYLLQHEFTDPWLPDAWRKSAPPQSAPLGDSASSCAVFIPAAL